jgi:hypothetical protein
MSAGVREPSELPYRNDVRDPGKTDAHHVATLLQRERDSELVLLELRREVGELVPATRISANEPSAAIDIALTDGASAHNQPRVKRSLTARWEHRDNGKESQGDESPHRCLLSPGARFSAHNRSWSTVLRYKNRYKCETRTCKFLPVRVFCGARGEI